MEDGDALMREYLPSDRRGRTQHVVPLCGEHVILKTVYDEGDEVALNSHHDDAYIPVQHKDRHDYESIIESVRFGTRETRS